MRTRCPRSHDITEPQHRALLSKLGIDNTGNPQEILEDLRWSLNRHSQDEYVELSDASYDGEIYLSVWSPSL